MIIFSRLKSTAQSAYKAAAICHAQKVTPLTAVHYKFSTENTNKDLQVFETDSDSIFNVLEKDPANPEYKTILKVMSAVHKEYKYEISQSSYLPRQETMEYLKKNNYTWVEEPNSAKVILQKSVGEYLVEMKFQIETRAQIPVEKETLKLEDLDLSQMLPLQREVVEEVFRKQKFKDNIKKEMEANDPGPRHFIQLEVLNNTQGSKLYFLIFTEGGQVRCNHIRYFSSEALATGFEGLKLFDLPQLYGGVNFHTLSEGLQKLFLKFLESLGIEAEVFYHIEYLAVNREQRLYMEMLKNIYDFAKADLTMTKELNESKGTAKNFFQK